MFKRPFRIVPYCLNSVSKAWTTEKFHEIHEVPLTSQKTIGHGGDTAPSQVNSAAQFLQIRFIAAKQHAAVSARVRRGRGGALTTFCLQSHISM